MCDEQTLSGPDFLDAVADAELASGNVINAAAYRQRASQWRAEQQLHDVTAASLASLQRRVTAANTQLAAAP